jgi:2-polyprenyl-3-methyl-5-hydroxy-6-metoxy-1,4-benzoquinol methylase
MTVALGYGSAIGRELLDDPAADPAMVAESLRNIARSNRLFGGVSAATFGVVRLLGDRPPPVVSLLDVGTGLGDLPRAIAARLARRGVRVVALGLELNPTAAGLARRAGLPTLRGTGLALPLADRSVDVVLLSQVAHHFSSVGVSQLAREATRVARVGVVVADLRRSRLAQVGFGVAARLLRFDPATRSDGVTSLRRGYRAGELRAVLGSAGIEAQCLHRPGSRVVAVWKSA